MASPLNAAVACFFANTSTPSQAQLDWLTKGQGVPNLALGRDDDGFGFVIGAAGVIYDRTWFDFAEPGDDAAHAALVLVARDSAGEPCDLVAWCPRTNKVATHYGRAGLLGEHNLLAPRGDGALPAHRSVLGWLKAGRCGFVVLDEGNAWRALEGVTIAAENVEHGLALRALLAPPLPSILVPQPEERAAA